MIEAKAVSNKFWILKDGSIKVGEVNIQNNKYNVSVHGQQMLYQTRDAVVNDTGINLPDVATPANKDKIIHGYPVQGDYFNAMWDLKLNLPLYTKNKDSKSQFAAGYYVIKIKGTWRSILSPKLIILQRNEYHGPYKEKSCI